ncbi:MAG: hypothetical protein JSU70_20290 [Phycisphaerales bacterium]|nr:MAG: hypothetical protein JSU70_20290 [Phycisphaerales bacterium]
MFSRHACISSMLLAFLCQQAQVSGMREVEFLCNKGQYLCGEPILLRTTVANLEDKNFVGELTSGGYEGKYCFGGSFTMHIALGDGEFRDILGRDTKRPSFPVSVPPLHVEYWSDRHGLPGRLNLGERSERVDMLVLSRPGDYKLMAVFKNRDRSVRMASDPIDLKVIPVGEEEEGFSRLADQAVFLKLGRAIHAAFYEECDEGLIGDSAVGELAAKILEEYPDSEFAEYIRYCHMLSPSPTQTEFRELAKGRKEPALRYVRENTSSWLLADLYRKLFWTYVAEKDREGAQKILNESSRRAPHAAVLKYVREEGAARLSKLPEAQVRPVSHKAWPAYMTAIAVAITVAVLGLTSLGGVVLVKRRRK